MMDLSPIRVANRPAALFYAPLLVFRSWGTIDKEGVSDTGLFHVWIKREIFGGSPKLQLGTRNSIPPIGFC